MYIEDQIKIIATGLGIKPKQVTSVLLLLEQGATIPFVARYRKELTEELNEEEITAIRDGYEKLTEITKRRESIINTLKETGQLTDDLELQLNNAVTLSELEDIYLPYRPKRKTRASVARDRGLEPLAKLLMRQQYDDVEKTARKYVNFEKEITTVEHALEGARDIIAEWVSENKVARERLRTLYRKRATIKSEVVKAKIEMAQNFSNYFDFEEPLDRSPSHRILAMLRGENEGFLRLQIAPPPNLALQILEKIFVKNESSAAQHVLLAVQDSYKRLLQPALENEFRADAKERADKEAIRIFVDNVRQLLMAPPLGQKRVLAIDPGFKTGCKIVCLDEQGKLLHNETIYPHPPQNEVRQSIAKIEQLVDAYKIDAIAIGNGTGGRETERLVRHLRFNREVIAVMVNESGASVYSASSVAREEFPDYDVTVRGAVSIGRRLIDPLAELVKIDPKSIGVGQYQHDVNQTQLARSLDDTVMSCVNAVGVEVNTASKQLLAYVSGIGPSLAQNIVSFRNQNGAFDSRQALNKVPRFGPKSFEQAAGFLRVNTSANPLDKTAVHPESYHIVEKMAKSLGVTVEELMKNADLQSKINIEEFVTDQAGIITIKRISRQYSPWSSKIYSTNSFFRSGKI
jgi:uncharacterized protein